MEFIALLFGLSIAFMFFMSKNAPSGVLAGNNRAGISDGVSFLNRMIRISSERAERGAARVSLVTVLCVIAILGMLVCYN